MKTLIAYATYSGGTEIASQIIHDRLSEKNISHDYLPVSQTGLNQLADYDLIILCTPTWDFNGKEGQPHEDFLKIISQSESNNLKDKKFAVMGLGDSSYTHYCGSVDVLETFITSVSGTIIIPSLRIDGFFYNQNAHNAAILAWTDSIIAAAAL